ncbi:MAG TPA: HNH endonuclease signature motif containing protein [Anaerolineales bacterium]
MKTLNSSKLRISIAVLMAAATILACGSSVTPTSNQSSTSLPNTSTANQGATTAPNPPSHQFGVQTKTSGCVSVNALPDSDCTPGAIFPDVTVAQICKPGYSAQVRNVPDSEKNQVYAEYGIASHSPGQYEVDHLVSLELGGSNNISNLWPEPAEPRPGFHEKDKVENYLHSQVCSGAISLQQAQLEISTNWLAVYQQMPSK